MERVKQFSLYGGLESSKPTREGLCTLLAQVQGKEAGAEKNIKGGTGCGYAWW